MPDDRIDLDDRGGLDDIAIHGVDLFHMEWMSDKEVWICLSRKGRPDEVFWLTSGKKIKGRHETAP